MNKLRNRPNMLPKKYYCINCILPDMNRECEMTEYEPPSNYPSEFIPKNGKLEPGELSFDILKSVDQCATAKLVNGK